MNDITPRKLKTGGDPRTLPDYGSLRDELSKLTHPARPDVSWRYVEKLCLALFEQNGVELQTAAWYTLARTHLAGLFGLNEGLSILEALISHQWGVLWPQPVHARMEILSGLSARLQQLIRALPLNYSDLSRLYLAEQQLTRLTTVLQRLELKHLSQLDTLRTMMHNSAVRLENSDDVSSSATVIQPGIVLNAQERCGAEISNASPDPDENESGGIKKWVYVPQTEPQQNVRVLTASPAQVNRWTRFIAGMAAMLTINVVALAGWQYFHRPDPLEAQLAASLAPLPAVLSAAQRNALKQREALPHAFLTETQQQLSRLDALPPDWRQQYSQQLIEQAEVLWSEQAKPLRVKWQQQLSANTLPAEAREGWHQGMAKLNQLSERLNTLDEHKGKYITVSELKSVIFSAMQSFNQTIPAEEQLRILSQNPAGQPLPFADQTQLDIHLKQLIARYAEIKQTASR
ncbi:hypothetical protein BBB56_21625 [Candidatus Pantoea deserta]|uniref:ImpA domain-containing protein n=1 Tax=Candidatus Pantoea deserta TaxID=1869313 RepID=A0A3N4NCC0_9GAMM|nr:VasL domain-containing protein [Pantoea deserta]RPD94052.1 hypothetical protein BBB56_21625 [Pantoea deserta]